MIRLRDSRRRRGAGAKLIIAASLLLQAAAAWGAEQKYWGTTPYAVRIELAVAAVARPEPQFAERLAARLQELVDAGIGPTWQADLRLTAGSRRWTLLEGLDAIDATQPAPDDLAGIDKLLLAVVVAVPGGYEIEAREFDAYLRRWSPRSTRFTAQQSLLAEACLAELLDAFSPLAEIRTLPDDDAHVELLPRGYELPTPGGESPLMHPGQPLQPLLRRTDRAGELLDNGVASVPWTYLSVRQRLKSGAWLADVASGVRQPFRIRRRGTVEQLAIGLHPVKRASTTVRFYARSNRDVGLAGYEVFRQLADGATAPLASTDRNGEIVVPHFGEPVTTMFLRSDGQLLAKVPVPPGALARLEVPIADDAARLQAQAELRTIREDLIDLVARRAILMGRVRAYLAAGRRDDAQKLMGELSELSTLTEFSRRIDVSQRSSKSADPQVQKRIETMFADTRSLLAKFLNLKQITDLQAEVNQAGAPN